MSILAGLTEAELLFLESPEGEVFMEETRLIHERTQAAKPEAYRLPFSEQQERAAIRMGTLMAFNHAFGRR